jgi:hypothetical protein
MLSPPMMCPPRPSCSANRRWSPYGSLPAPRCSPPRPVGMSRSLEKGFGSRQPPLIGVRLSPGRRLEEVAEGVSLYRRYPSPASGKMAPSSPAPGTRAREKVRPAADASAAVGDGQLGLSPESIGTSPLASWLRRFSQSITQLTGEGQPLLSPALLAGRVRVRRPSSRYTGAGGDSQRERYPHLHPLPPVMRERRSLLRRFGVWG